MFIDECGDQNLSAFDENFPIFTLCGVLMSQGQLRAMENKITALKKKYWGDKTVILHSRDIRKFDFLSKKQNVTGLQLADIIAYPITQYLLYPDRVNFAYDIVKNNIYVSDGKKLGLKVIPRPEKEV